MIARGREAKAMPGGFFLCRGPEFSGSPKEAREFLRARKIDDRCSPAAAVRVELDTEAALIVTQTLDGDVRQGPMREAFFEKLLRWHGLPAEPHFHMPPDLVARVLNWALDRIRPAVRVRWEDGDALTITGPNFVDLPDLDVLEACPPDGRFKVRRGDLMLRLTCHEEWKTEPRSGDPSGFGHAILNSETGFAALRVQTYILRFACSNGTAVQFAEDHAAMPHYGSDRLKMNQALAEGIRRARDAWPFLARRLAEIAQSPMPPTWMFMDELARTLNWSSARTLLADFSGGPNATLYDFYNHVTSAAKVLPMRDGQRLELFAGRLLLRAPPRGAEQGRSNLPAQRALAADRRARMADRMTEAKA